MIEKLTPIEKLTTIEPPRPPEGEQGRAVGSYGIFRHWRLLKFIIAAVFALIVFVAVIPGWLQKCSGCGNSATSASSGRSGPFGGNCLPLPSLSRFCTLGSIFALLRETPLLSAAVS